MFCRTFLLTDYLTLLSVLLSFTGQMVLLVNFTKTTRFVVVSTGYDEDVKCVSPKSYGDISTVSTYTP